MANKYRNRRWLVCLAFAAVLVTAAAGCESGGAPRQLQPTESGDGQQQTTGNAKDAVYKIGDIIQLGSNKLTVNDVVKSQGGEFDKPKSGNEFVIVKVTIENAGDSSISYNPFDFKMQNSQGQITDPALTTVDQDTTLQSGDLAPGGKVSGTIAFDQPKNDNQLQLQYTPNFFGQTVKVNLQ